MCLKVKRPWYASIKLRKLRTETLISMVPSKLIDTTVTSWKVGRLVYRTWINDVSFDLKHIDYSIKVKSRECNGSPDVTVVKPFDQRRTKMTTLKVKETRNNILTITGNINISTKMLQNKEKSKQFCSLRGLIRSRQWLDILLVLLVLWGFCYTLWSVQNCFDYSWWFESLAKY